MELITFKNVSFGYNANNLIFRGFNLKIKAKKSHIVALMGASGCGKSTLFKLMLRNEIPNKGSITFDKYNPVIAYLPQEPVLFEHLTPIQNARYFQNSSYYKKHFSETLFLGLMKSLNIQDVLEKSKSVLELSGGQRQRLSLLRALSIQPDLLLLDEPTTGLDATIKIQFLSKLREVVLEYGLTVIYITHHKVETELIADEIIFLSKDESSSSIKAYQNDLLSFIKYPPLLEAFEVFSYPKPNIIKARVKQNEIIPLDHGKEHEVFYLGVKKENISFSAKGLKYETVFSNSMNTTIRFSNTTQYILLSTKEILNNKQRFLNFVGEFNIYGLDGRFVKTINLKNN